MDGNLSSPYFSLFCGPMRGGWARALSRVCARLIIHSDSLTDHTYYTKKLSASWLYAFHLLTHKRTGLQFCDKYIWSPKKCFTKNFYFYILACVSWLLKHVRRVSFLLKRKRWKKNCCGKWFPINETHCAMVYTAMWTNDRVPIRNWRRPLLFASFCFPTECFLVYSSDTLTLPFTEIWFDSRRNWVPMGGPETPPPTMSYISFQSTFLAWMDVLQIF